MDDYPGNPRFREKKAEEKPQKEEPKRIEKVTVGKVTLRKKPLGRKFKDVFFGGDTDSVGAYILHEILIPAIKDTVLDMLNQGSERLIFGEARSTSRRTGSRPSGSRGYVSYDRYSRDDRPPFKPDPRSPESRGMSRRGRASHDFGEFVLSTRIEAEEVIDNLVRCIQQYDQVTVADLYDLLGMDPQFTDHKWGWTDLQGARTRRVREGYVLELPSPIQLD